MIILDLLLLIFFIINFIIINNNYLLIKYKCPYGTRIGRARALGDSFSGSEEYETGSMTGNNNVFGELFNRLLIVF